MKKTLSIEEARHWFAEDLRAAAPVVHNPEIIEAFAKVPREKFLGEGPWRIRPREFSRPRYLTPTAEPHHVYHDLLISIDDALDLNNGQPSLWAFVLDQLGLRPGERVMQVGAGVGYFTAVIAELVTPAGRVIAYEVNAELAERARANLKDYTQAEVLSGDATKVEKLPAFDVIIVFAGATHVPRPWLASLSQSGRLVIPLTKENHWGFLLLLKVQGDRLSASSLGPCNFYHCEGARKPEEAAALKYAIETTGGKVPPLDQLHRGRPPENHKNAWYLGDGFWLSKA